MFCVRNQLHDFMLSKILLYYSLTLQMNQHVSCNFCKLTSDNPVDGQIMRNVPFISVCIILCGACSAHAQIYMSYLRSQLSSWECTLTDLMFLQCVSMRALKSADLVLTHLICVSYGIVPWSVGLGQTSDQAQNLCCMATCWTKSHLYKTVRQNHTATYTSQSQHLVTNSYLGVMLQFHSVYSALHNYWHPQ